MKKFTFITFFILAAKLCFSQTATDFTANDCAGKSHNLFAELNSGKIIVLVWVMPCGTCISDAKAGYDAAQSFATSNPGRVVYWLADDYGNYSCANLTSWASQNGIVPANITVFGNAGNLIDEANYGGSAMPHVVVLGGWNHKIHYNKRAGSNDGLAIQQAITQAIATGISPHTVSNSSIQLFPNPVKNKMVLQGMNRTNSNGFIEIRNILGETVHSMIIENEFMNNGLVEINLPVNFPKGNYILIWRNEAEYQNLKFTVNE